MATTDNYTPVSHFFVDHSALTDVTPSTATPSTSATSIQTTTSSPFGPVSTSQYSTTSVVQTSSTTPVKVYAICDGQILIQPCVDDVSNKVNLVLKPSATYAPLKIKCFIYRGVNKADLIGTDSNVVKWDTSVSGQPHLLYTIYNSKSSEDIISGKNVGYKESTDATFLATSIDSCFTSTSGYQLPVCSAGDHIGYFSTSIGLDVVLDDGVYTLEKTTEPFSFDLSYARVLNHYLDTSKVAAKISSISGANSDSYIARYREYVHQFMDAAAFWGSHAGTDGDIVLSNGNKIKSASDIYTNILQKYQTPNNVYIYLKAERGRSYNFADTTKKVYFEQTDATSTSNYYLYQDTSGWPILIKQYTVSSIYMKVQYHISAYVHESDQLVPVKIISPKCNYFKSNTSLTADKMNNETWAVEPKTGVFEYTFSNLVLNSDKTVASFIFINTKVNQSETEKYYNDLWPVDIRQDQLLKASTDTQIISLDTVDKAIIKDLNPILHCGAEMQHKIIHEKGTDGTAKRLYQAIIKDNTKCREAQPVGNEAQLNISRKPATTGLIKIDADNEYVEYAYDDNCNYVVYKSQFNIDASTTNYSLSLTNADDFELNKSYFQLGIMETEYDTIAALIPKTGANAYFYLYEAAVAVNSDYQKFVLGIQYEDNANSLQTPSPSISDAIYVYTLDGLYFFSLAYAGSHEYNKTFADSLASFRPKSKSSVDESSSWVYPKWAGEYGFDWIRIGDTKFAGDGIKVIPNSANASNPTIVNRTNYYDIGHYYSTQSTSYKQDPDQDQNIVFNFEMGEWVAFRNNYPSYPIKKYTAIPSIFNNTSFTAVDYYMYSASFISLYPSDVTNSGNAVFPGVTTDGTKKCQVEATLDLRLEVSSSATSFRVAYDSAYLAVTFLETSGVTFTATAGNCQITGLSSGTNTLTVNVKSIKGTNTYQKIQVYAAEGGTERLAGELWIMPNDKNHRKNLKVYLISVKTKLDGSSTTNHGINYSDSTQINTLEDTLTKYFNQALIDVTCISKTPDLLDIEIDTTSSIAGFSYESNNKTTFNSDYQRVGTYTYDDSTGTSITTALCLQSKTSNDLKVTMHDKLYNVLKGGDYPYNDGLVLFYVNEICLIDKKNTTTNVTKYYPLFGVAYPYASLTKNQNTVILFRGDSLVNSLSDSSSAHEGCHDLGLSHTFSDYSDYTIRINMTDNIMDYSSASKIDPIAQISTWRVQWNEIKKRKLVK